MKRLFAALVAVAMVLLAVLLRGLIDNDNGKDDGGGSGAGGELVVICGPELLAACNEIAADTDGMRVQEEPEHITAQLLADGELDLDANTLWLAAGDWPAIVASGDPTGDSTGAQRLDELVPSGVLARSPAVIVGRSERIDAAVASCGNLDWSCVGDAAGDPWTDLGGEPTWGDVKVGLPDVDTGSGMVTVNQAVASRVGRSDFASNDLEAPEVTQWFERLARESSSTARSAGSLEPLAELIRVPGSLSMAGALEADAVRELGRAASASAFTVVVPEPIATADVRLWGPDEETVTNTVERIGAERIRDALGGTGWRIPDGDGSAPPPPGAASIDADMASPDTPLPEDSGLPPAGVVFTVNERWKEAP